MAPMTSPEDRARESLADLLADVGGRDFDPVAREIANNHIDAYGRPQRNDDLRQAIEFALRQADAEAREDCERICVDLMKNTKRRTPNLGLPIQKSPVLALSEAATAIRASIKKEGGE